MEHVSVEAATAEFERFVDCMDLDINEKEMSAEDKVDFTSLKRQFLKAVQEGHMTVNDDGEPTVIFKKPPGGDYPESVTFYEPDGAAFLALDKGKKDADASKQYLMMAEVCKVQPTLFQKLKNRDLRVCKAVFTLFLG